MSAVVVARRRVAVRLLLLEAALLAGILGAFALVSAWRVGTATLLTLVLLGAVLIAPVLAAQWVLVRRDWRRLDLESERVRRPP